MVVVSRVICQHTAIQFLHAPPLDIAAYPESVNILEGVTGDVRTPDKLVDGVYDTDDARHMWLAPLLPDVVGDYCLFQYSELCE